MRATAATDTGPGTGLGAGTAAGPLLVLTAAELEVLEAAHAAELRATDTAGPGPTTDMAATATTAATARAEAQASLVARGVLSTDGRPWDGTTAGAVARLVLDIRLGATAMIVVERLLGGTHGGRDLRMLHLVDGGGVVEDVLGEGSGAAGSRGFDLVPDPDVLVATVTQMLVPPDATAGVGEPVVLDPDTVDRFPGLVGHPTVLAELTLVRPGEEQATAPPEEGHLLALGPGGCWAARRAGDRPPLVRPVPPEHVEELVRGWVRSVVDELPEDSGAPDDPGAQGTMAR